MKNSMINGEEITDIADLIDPSGFDSAASTEMGD